MNPNNQGPLGPDQGQPRVTQSRPFTPKALAAKFSYSFTREQLIMMTNILASQQFVLGDPRAKILIRVLDEIDRTAFQSITEADYESESPENPVTNNVKVN